MHDRTTWVLEQTGDNSYDTHPRVRFEQIGEEPGPSPAAHLELQATLNRVYRESVEEANRNAPPSSPRTINVSASLRMTGGTYPARRKL